MVLKILNHYLSIKVIFYNVLLFLICSSTFAQEKIIKTDTLPTVLVTSSRILESKKKIPLSISAIELENRKNISQQLSLNDYINTIPGLFALNANNFSQDLRVSIRGFGARSAFGIRGVKIIVDGIPETTPDGQGQIDNLDIGSIDRIEIIRGPSSSLYGNASGGVINVFTQNAFKEDYVKVGLTFGSYELQNYQISTGFRLKKTRFIVHKTNTLTNGYREQIGFKSSNLNLRMLHDISDNTKLNLQFNYTDSPYAEDAGGLTLEELVDDRTQARGRNLDFKTEESINQFKLGTSFNHKWSNNTINAYGFFSNRNFYGLLPFENGGIVDLERNYYGIGSSFNVKQEKEKFQNTFQIGFDLAQQIDDRKRFNNLNGDQGDIVLDQEEQFSNIGFYALNHLKVNKFLVRVGVRYDINNIEAIDELLINGNQSGDINLNAFNPSIGLSYMLKKNHSVYTNFSTSFETPVLSELSASESGNGGFNTSLEPQKAQSFEVGYKLDNNNLNAELALFYIKTMDDIISYELEMFPGRAFYRNAGKTIRKGLELSGTIKINTNFNFKLNYSYSDFIFETYSTNSSDFDGNELPGIPKHMGSITLLYYNKNGINVRFVNQFVGQLFVNDLNSIKDQGYLKTDLNIGYAQNFNNLQLTPFVGINNLFNVAYNDNIRINAFGGRYYEPAPKLNVFAGIRLMHKL
jgi:iron complex outermembrane receptor protein